MEYDFIFESSIGELIIGYAVVIEKAQVNFHQVSDSSIKFNTSCSTIVDRTGILPAPFLDNYYHFIYLHLFTEV
ncbi:MAG: hypothetical protein WBV73_24120 [Phormidium sp.]